LDPLRYSGLRLIEDAAYGSGVIAGALRHRSVEPLIPTVRRPAVVDRFVPRFTGRSRAQAHVSPDPA
jgi:hypothetical protein